MDYQPYNGYQPYGRQQYQQPVNNLTRVTGIEGARLYQMPPNSTVALFDGNEDVFYVKATDGAGFPTIRTFRFEEVPQQAQQQPDYVTRDELGALSEKIDKLMEALNG